MVGSKIDVVFVVAVPYLVGIQIKSRTLNGRTADQSTRNAPNNNNQTQKQGIPIQRLDHIIRIAGGGIEDQIDGKHDNGKQSGNGGHGDGQGQFCVEDAAPPGP